MPEKIYTTQRPLEKQHDVDLNKKLFVTQRDTGFERSVDLTKEIYDVDAVTAFFLLTEDNNFILLEDGGRIISYYG